MKISDGISERKLVLFLMGVGGSIKPFSEEDINISKGLKKISSEDIRRVPK